MNRQANERSELNHRKLKLVLSPSNEYVVALLGFSSVTKLSINK